MLSTDRWHPWPIAATSKSQVVVGDARRPAIWKNTLLTSPVVSNGKGNVPQVSDYLRDRGPVSRPPGAGSRFGSSLAGIHSVPPLSCSSMLLVQLILSFFLLCPCVSPVHGSQTFWPAAIPYAVRSPYLNTWQNPFTASGSTDNWPFFWNNGVSSVGVCVPFISQ